MATTERMIIGAFEGPQRTEQVINELLHAGFSNDQIRFSGHQTATGSVLASLTSLFLWRGTAADTPIDDVVGLVGMGVPEEDARYYHREFEAGRDVVAIMANRHLQEAIDILTHYGGDDAVRQFTLTGADSFTAGTRTTTWQMQVNTEGDVDIQGHNVEDAGHLPERKD
jgi:hypothetical protein